MTTVTFSTAASIVVERVTTSSTVLARIGLAFVDVQLASFTAVAFRTVANELTNAIFTASAIHARVRFAFIDVTQAAGVEIATRAVTFKAIDQIRAFA